MGSPVCNCFRISSLILIYRYSLWGTDTICFILKKDERGYPVGLEGEKYANRKMLCKASTFFLKLFPSPRCWPSQGWNDIFASVPGECIVDLWRSLESYITFFYKRSLVLEGTIMERLTLFGHCVMDPEFYNFCIIGCCEGAGERQQTRDYVWQLEKLLRDLKDPKSIEAAYDSQRFVQYIVDNIIWDLNHSRHGRRTQSRCALIQASLMQNELMHARTRLHLMTKSVE